MNMKEDIKKAITNLSLTQVSYQKGVNSDIKQMEEQINRTLNSFQKAFDSGLISVKDEVRKTLMSLQKQVDAAPNSCRYVKSTEARAVVTLASGLKVMCDTKTDGGGWIIIQRRINGKLDFFKGWNEYRDGFGDYNIGEFYLGNENIFLLTSRKQQELRFDLEYKNRKYFARYSDFKLLGENDKYQLKIGRYSGNAGDSMKRHHNLFFTTYDEDNDNHNNNCAYVRYGAWWYDDCADVNLNGRWGRGEPDGIFWDTVTVWESVSFSEMKIRENE
uniref:Fibrinogen C-terminal domain-containing protein n=1 Tax=Biomphalaria glabrata TaxID=6526 RepID=A0A2C9KJU9_BIOGL